MAKKPKKHVAGPAASAKPTIEKSAPRRTRKQSTKQERAKILSVAEKEGLTALQVQKRFGVKPVTYYSWRKAQKRSGAHRRAVRRPNGAVAGLDVTGAVRASVRAHIARMLPEIVRSEVARAFDGAGRRK